MWAKCKVLVKGTIVYELTSRASPRQRHATESAFFKATIHVRIQAFVCIGETLRSMDVD